jgi:hypothetical protein
VLVIQPNALLAPVPAPAAAVPEVIGKKKEEEAAE